ncbi:hypothetical protein B0H16DRAFT_1753716 [Mycena metata]|uniref:Uncharacterized protein n=1 Tax=Mycena metata TaxID=1033252 RepID=A0AAD7KIR3_9AGAR|nr:hypothetical protein B0H16DRAFT_1753716 [Mycena metata]
MEAGVDRPRAVVYATKVDLGAHISTPEHTRAHGIPTGDDVQLLDVSTLHASPPYATCGNLLRAGDDDGLADMGEHLPEHNNQEPVDTRISHVILARISRTHSLTLHGTFEEPVTAGMVFVKVSALQSSHVSMYASAAGFLRRDETSVIRCVPREISPLGVVEEERNDTHARWVRYKCGVRYVRTPHLSLSPALVPRPLVPLGYPAIVSPPHIRVAKSSALRGMHLPHACPARCARPSSLSASFFTLTSLPHVLPPLFPGRTLCPSGVSRRRIPGAHCGVECRRHPTHTPWGCSACRVCAHRVPTVAPSQPFPPPARAVELNADCIKLGVAQLRLLCAYASSPRAPCSGVRKEGAHVARGHQLHADAGNVSAVPIPRILDTADARNAQNDAADDENAGGRVESDAGARTGTGTSAVRCGVRCYVRGPASVGAGLVGNGSPSPSLVFPALVLRTLIPLVSPAIAFPSYPPPSRHRRAPAPPGDVFAVCASHALHSPPSASSPPSPSLPHANLPVPRPCVRRCYPPHAAAPTRAIESTPNSTVTQPREVHAVESLRVPALVPSLSPFPRSPPHPRVLVRRVPVRSAAGSADAHARGPSLSARTVDSFVRPPSLLSSSPPLFLPFLVFSPSSPYIHMSAANDSVRPVAAAAAALTADERKAFGLAAAKTPAVAAVKNIAAVLPDIEDDDDSSDGDLSNRVSSKFRTPHLYWDFRMEGPNTNLPISVHGLIDNGAHLVLIHPDVVDRMGLKRRRLHKPEDVEVAMNDDTTTCVSLSEYVKFPALSNDLTYESNTVRTLIAPNLCADVILGLPFLTRNHIVVDHNARTAVDKRINYDLLGPPIAPTPKVPKVKLREKLRKTKADHKLLAEELKSICADRLQRLTDAGLFESVREVDVVAAIRQKISHFEESERRQKLGDKLKSEYRPIFEPIPHVDNLPTDVLCEIKMKDAYQSISKRSYQSPRKYKDAWQILIQKHLDAGRIRPSNSPYALKRRVIEYAAIWLLFALFSNSLSRRY